MTQVLPVDLGRYTLFDLSLVVVAVVAVAFGIVWLVVNLYHFYPFFQYTVARLLPTESPDEDVYAEPVDLEDVPVAALPEIDVLLPAYEEGTVIHQSIGSIRNARYPQELIRVNVLLEPDDEDTRAALADLRDQFEFREVTVPGEYTEIVVPDRYPGMPNKPRALNYGFELTDAPVVGVVDAEDVVDPDLFAHVYGALFVEGYDYVQGTLDMVNEDDGWMNLVFRSEYAWWFEWLLPAFHWLGYPVPLGGTTNFFHRSVLDAVSRERYERYGDPWPPEQRAWFERRGLSGTIPWDPRNVTEDFELGLLLWMEGYDLGLLDVVTREESPLDVDAWIRQRTRWQKGKIYTFVQYAYALPPGIRQKYHLLLQSFLPHLAPVNIAGIVILAMVANVLGLGMPLGAALILTLGLVFLVEINAVHAYSYWRVSETALPVRAFRTLLVLVTLQLYWVPLWGAEQRAMKQVYLRQLDWEKTAHHGRNVPDDGPVVQPPEPAERLDVGRVVVGFAVAVIGLAITVGLPLVLLG